MKDELISIIIPCFNVEKYLELCLESVCKQTYMNLEIICVDDGSTDRTIDIIRKFMEKDSRISLVIQKNSYAGVARNNGMDRAKGKYFLFLDADDIFEPIMVEKAYEFAEVNKTDITVFGAKSFADYIENARSMVLFEKNLIPENQVVIKEQAINYIFQIASPCPWNKLFLAEFIKRNHLKFQECKRMNDAFFVEMAMALADKIGFIYEEFVYYRTNNQDSLQGSKKEDPTHFIQVFDKLKEELVRRELYEGYKKSFKVFCLKQCMSNLLSMNDVNAIYMLCKELEDHIFDDYGIEEFYSLFPFNKVKPGSDIILYGAGKLGKSYYEQIKKTKYCNVILWVDANAEKMRAERVCSPCNIRDYVEELIIVAVKDKCISGEIKYMLMNDYKIDKNRII